ncbi:PROTEIN FAR1-RELATED SEQUENCE 2-LIKE ISOFORM X1 [Salix purpurea]|uniref:PROTEIN FAR1-RELATED SEQUENCE 2-LIKE ISOFORM X1 n=1 Tax=Salix purpurea TaxID=77065 RepID=A0A9Q0ZNR3_SALPP|nr:PROTEIN FAR1-RELATED SEQUENCE 2-LIKE ISOFORM X1 [Salix purpurea]
MARIPGCTSIAQDVLKVDWDFIGIPIPKFLLILEIETLVEDKIVTTESIVGGETGACEVDTSQEPYEGMVFESEKSARVFYDEYAKQGRISYTNCIIPPNTGQVKIRKRESKREGCMAMILVKREKPGKWLVTKFMRDHNHPLVISSKKGRPTPDEKDERIRELSSQLHHTNRQLASKALFKTLEKLNLKPEAARRLLIGPDIMLVNLVQISTLVSRCSVIKIPSQWYNSVANCFEAL